MIKTTAPLIAAALLAGCANQASETPRQLVARGEYLVTRVAGCNDCHTPMTPKGPDMRRSLQGAELLVAPRIDMPWMPRAPQIAGRPANFSHEQFVHFLQTGIRPDGSNPAPPMPPYRLNEADARAVAAYVESLPRAQE
ncbi:MAG: hypothetical protein B7Y45_01645 [Sphingomonas sp. 28-66-16]|nr:MAG: hypothetical protein B7Y45_01645 [Sphingomonas sp. 28-66-16]